MWLQCLPYLLLHNVLVALLQVAGHIHHLGWLLWQAITSQLSLTRILGISAHAWNMPVSFNIFKVLIWSSYFASEILLGCCPFQQYRYVRRLCFDL